MRYDLAMRNIIVHNVEVTTTEHYERWLAERWGVARGTRHNSSEPIIAREEAIRIGRDFLAAQSAEDQKLYDVISYALTKLGQCSVTGLELPKLIGPSLLEALAQNDIPPLEDAQPRVRAWRTLVASGHSWVAFRMAPISADLHGIRKIETVLTADFSANGRSNEYRVKGWANAEPNFTWTSGPQATISLPALEGDGDFFLRLVTSAYVVKVKLPEQTVKILAGDLPVGECTVRDLSVLECDLPSELIATRQPITITLLLPDAACPREVNGADDGRMLALAVRSIAVLRVARISGSEAAMAQTVVA